MPFLPTAQAQADITNYNNLMAPASYGVFDLVQTGIAWAIIAAAFLCIVFIFVGGFSFILSGGDEAKVKKAVSTIRYAIIGLVITILAITAVTFIGSMFGIDLVFVKIQDILEQVSNIITHVTATSSSATPQI